MVRRNAPQETSKPEKRIGLHHMYEEVNKAPAMGVPEEVVNKEVTENGGETDL